MIAYGLRAEYDGTVDTPDGTTPAYQGGVIGVDEAREVNIAEALEAGGGKIIADPGDNALVTALDAYPALKRIAADQDAAPTVARYDGLTSAELRRELAVRDLSPGGAKAELVDRLEAHDVAVAAGDQAGAANPTPATMPVPAPPVPAAPPPPVPAPTPQPEA